MNTAGIFRVWCIQYHIRHNCNVSWRSGNLLVDLPKNCTELQSSRRGRCRGHLGKPIQHYTLLKTFTLLWLYIHIFSLRGCFWNRNDDACWCVPSASSLKAFSLLIPAPTTSKLSGHCCIKAWIRLKRRPCISTYLFYWSVLFERTVHMRIPTVILMSLPHYLFLSGLSHDSVDCAYPNLQVTWAVNNMLIGFRTHPLIWNRNYTQVVQQSGRRGHSQWSRSDSPPLNGLSRTLGHSVQAAADIGS